MELMLRMINLRFIYLNSNNVSATNTIQFILSFDQHKKSFVAFNNCNRIFYGAKLKTPAAFSHSLSISNEEKVFLCIPHQNLRFLCDYREVMIAELLTRGGINMQTAANTKS